jgi:hypothetical protein
MYKKFRTAKKQPNTVYQEKKGGVKVREMVTQTRPKVNQRKRVQYRFATCRKRHKIQKQQEFA